MAHSAHFDIIYLKIYLKMQLYFGALTVAFLNAVLTSINRVN